MTFDMQGNRENSIVLLQQFRMDTSKLTSTGAIYRNFRMGGGGGGLQPPKPPSRSAPDQVIQNNCDNKEHCNRHRSIINNTLLCSLSKYMQS